MKIYYHCNHCNPKTKVEIGRKCDTCGTESALGLPIELRIDDTDCDFCGLKCTFQFIIGELKKENKDDRFEYGKEN